MYACVSCVGGAGHVSQNWRGAAAPPQFRRCEREGAPSTRLCTPHPPRGRSRRPAAPSDSNSTASKQPAWLQATGHGDDTPGTAAGRQPTLGAGRRAPRRRRCRLRGPSLLGRAALRPRRSVVARKRQATLSSMHAAQAMRDGRPTARSGRGPLSARPCTRGTLVTRRRTIVARHTRCWLPSAASGVWCARGLALGSVCSTLDARSVLHLSVPTCESTQLDRRHLLAGTQHGTRAGSHGFVLWRRHGARPQSFRMPARRAASLGRPETRVHLSRRFSVGVAC
jgi:hypothetical protein